jgi:hypothetical protein
MNVVLNGEHVKLSISRRYQHMPGQVSIEAVCLNGEPYASVTVCIPGVDLSSDETILDINNIPDALTVLVMNNCVEDLGRSISSGFCEYPVVRVIAPIN